MESNNRQDIRALEKVLEQYSFLANQSDEAQKVYNRYVRKMQVDRQLATSYCKLEAEMELIGCMRPDAEPGRQIISFLCDRPERVFVATGLPLTRDEETKQITTHWVDDPERPGMHIQGEGDLNGVQLLEHCSADARAIVAKLGTRAADGCYPQRHVISMAYFPDLEELSNHMRDAYSAMQFYKERAFFGDSAPDFGGDEEEEEMWG